MARVLGVMVLLLGASSRALATPQDPSPPAAAPRVQDPDPKNRARDPEASSTQEVIVTGRSADLTGVAESATEGKIGQKEIETRVMVSPGETLETVPGLIVTQHSGSGKANQYFLRGFNLDHGTDFATWVNGMPINMPTHAHGQGYTDLNWLIPELIEGIDFRKGPYYADEGDFSAAGAIHMEYVDRLEHGSGVVSLGTDGYARGLLIGSVKAADGDLAYGIEGFHDDGPWDNPDNYVRQNLFLRYSRGDSLKGWNITAMAYQGKWTSTDQIAQRAVDQGLLDRFGSLDPSDGGKSYRYSFSGEWHNGDAHGMTRAHAYGIDYGLDLYNNFTYFLEDPVHGDQFHQLDRRVVLGGDLSHDWFTRVFGMEEKTTLGLQTRNDFIRSIGLFHTQDRALLSTVSLDTVAEDSVGLYLSENIQFLSWLRGTFGGRGDLYSFDVRSHNIPENSGTRTEAIGSPKASVVVGPWSQTEVYLQWGEGYHSNDGRGTVIKVDPTTGLPVQTVSPLVRAKGADIGARTTIIPGLQSTLSFYYLDLASELTFDGDHGTTEAGRPSRRLGVELGNFYTVTSWLTVDADLAYAKAYFTASDPDPAITGSHIPGAVEGVAEAGVAADLGEGFFSSLRFRYFGPRPLIQDNSEGSRATNLFQGRIGYRYQSLTLALECLNMADSKDHQIDYFYASRLAGEPAGGVSDIHFHPVEPREFRLGLTFTF